MKKPLKENEVVFLGDQFIQDIVNINILKIWDFLSGKKTYLAMALLFVYGGLSYFGYELTWLKDTALWLGGIGVLHGAYKGIVK